MVLELVDDFGMSFDFDTFDRGDASDLSDEGDDFGWPLELIVQW